MHLFLLGIILGWGAAIPIGPVNLEMIRRNIRYGISHGLALGFGACSADLFYLILLIQGLLVLLQHTMVMTIVGFISAFLLAYFGIMALKSSTPQAMSDMPPKKALFRTYIEGLMITFFNPFTILFWASVSTQIAIAAQNIKYTSIFAGAGVILGTVSWMLSLNLILHYTRHKLSQKIMHNLNLLGGAILLVFAVIGLIHTFY